jgi:methylated-DNA-[protein]-cysteine S-methyltransferase
MTMTTNPTTYYTLLPSPVDDLLLVSDGDALTGLYLGGPPRGDGDGDGHGMAVDAAWTRDPGPFREALRQLRAYFGGELARFDLPITLRGTAFQQAVWEALRALRLGERISYGELARRIGRPGASRAVGLANARNPISIIVPCHRVLGAGGALTGYGGGLGRKQWLLEHEARLAAALS